MTKWLLLAAAIALEVSGSLSLKAGGDHIGWYSVVAVGYIGSFLILVQVLKRGVPIGVAYGIWGASGVALTALLAAAIFGESLSIAMLLGIALIIGGVFCIEMGSRQPSGSAAA